ncbi:MAG: hypothetical protein M0Z57_07125 [Deltaproteobacteria bacterium]|jgi:hypothetical protein|nr:hypothetical protein [Deltaproteobacteria bacterium]
MTTSLYILIPVLIIFVLAFCLDWGHKDELELNSNIIGYGKAKGLYIIKMENYYVVAGIKVKSKRKAVKEFMHLVEENGFLPPGMYFKTFKTEENIKPIANTVKQTNVVKKQESIYKQQILNRQEGSEIGWVSPPRINDKKQLKPENQKFRRR